jgi:hypothetical protein
MNTIVSTFRQLQDVEYMLEVSSSNDIGYVYVSELKREQARLKNQLSNLIGSK